MDVSPPELDPKIRTEFGLMHLSGINGILFRTVWKVIDDCFEAFSKKGLGLGLYKNPANRDASGRLYTWVTLSLFQRHPTGIDPSKPFATYKIQLVSNNIPRKKNDVESETRKHLEGLYGGKVPRQRDDTWRMWCCALLPILLLVILILYEVNCG